MLSKDKEIIIVDETADMIKKFDDDENKYNMDVWQIKGNPMDKSILDQAVGFEDNTAIILSEKDINNTLSDTNSINTALAIESFENNYNVFTVLEIHNTKNKFHFRRTEINEWICVEDFALKMISQSALQNYLSRIYINLMGGNRRIYAGNKISLIPLNKFGVIKNNENLVKYSEIGKSENVKKIGVLIGFEKEVNQEFLDKYNMNLRNNNKFIQLNPSSPERIIHASSEQIFDDDSFWIVDENYKRVALSKETKLMKTDKLILITKVNKRFQKMKKVENTNRIKEKFEMDKMDKMNDKDKDKLIKKSQEEIWLLNQKLNKVRHIKEISFCGHTLICNWNSKATTIIEELHDETLGTSNPIVILAEDINKVILPETKAFNNVIPLLGDPTNENALLRANIHEASTIIILADDADYSIADAKSIKVSLAVASINPKAHSIVELVHSRNNKYFEYTNVDEIICLEELSEKLLAQSALTHGLSRIYMDLLTQSSDTNEIYIESIPASFIGKKYSEAEEAIMKTTKDVILIGFSTIETKFHSNGSKKTNSRGKLVHERRVIINPSREKNNQGFSVDYEFNHGDQLFMISYDKPYIEFNLTLDSCKKESKYIYVKQIGDTKVVNFTVKQINPGDVILLNNENEEKKYCFKEIDKLSVEAFEI